MYGPKYIRTNINNTKMHLQAESEAAFLASKLSLNAETSVIDIACGAGRHLKALNKYSQNLTGVDISEHCISTAKANCPAHIKFYLGNMYSLSAFYGQFDVALCLFTSFGFFSDDESNLQVLKEIHKVLKPGGTFVLQLIDEDWFHTVFAPEAESEVEGLVVKESRVYDPETKYVTTKIRITDTNTSAVEETGYHCRIYNKDEILLLLNKAGFFSVKVYGDAEGNEYRAKFSKRPYYFASR
jgi:SAM-dependent methyltransferase